MAEFKGFISAGESAISDSMLNKYYEYKTAAYNAHRYVQAFYCFSKQKVDCPESRFNNCAEYVF